MEKIRKTVVITSVIVLLCLQSCDYRVNSLENDLRSIRSLQNYLKQIVDDNDIMSVYCYYDNLDNTIQFSMFDTVIYHDIEFTNIEYIDKYNMHIHNKYIKIDSLYSLVRICNMLYSKYRINKFQYIDYYHEFNNDSFHYRQKQYPSVNRELTPDEMFNISSFVELKTDVYKFMSAYKFVDTHKEDLGNIGVSEVGEEIFLYYERYQ